MTTAIDLLAVAMARPRDDWEQLAADLLDSVEPVPGGISIADIAEIEHRATEARADAPGIPCDDVNPRLAR